MYIRLYVSQTCKNPTQMGTALYPNVLIITLGTVKNMSSLSQSLPYSLHSYEITAIQKYAYRNCLLN